MPELRCSWCDHRIIPGPNATDAVCAVCVEEGVSPLSPEACYWCGRRLVPSEMPHQMCLVCVAHWAQCPDVSAGHRTDWLYVVHPRGDRVYVSAQELLSVLWGEALWDDAEGQDA